MSAKPRTKFWHKIQQNFPTRFREVNPVKVDDREGRSNKRYGFSRVHFDRAPDLEVDIPEVDTYYFSDPPVGASDVEDMLVWQYEGKPAVFITPERVYVEETAGSTESKRQAYYAINYLDGEAMVSGWSK